MNVNICDNINDIPIEDDGIIIVMGDTRDWLYHTVKKLKENDRKIIIVDKESFDFGESVK